MAEGGGHPYTCRFCNSEHNSYAQRNYHEATHYPEGDVSMVAEIV